MEYGIQFLQTMIFASIIICLVWGIGHFVNNKAGYRWRKYLWVIIAIRLIIPVNPGILSTGAVDIKLPEIKTALSSQKFVNTQSSGAVSDELKKRNVTDGDNTSTQQEAKQTNSDNYIESDGNKNSTNVGSKNPTSVSEFIAENVMTIILSLWVAVVALLGMFRICQYRYMCRKYLGDSRICTRKNVVNILTEISGEYGIKRIPSVKECSIYTSPMLMGYFNTTLILPKTDYTNAELEAVIRHEMNHYKSKDLWYKLLMVIVCDIYWFNPIFRLMKRMAFQDVEYVCDENATRSMSSAGKRNYCNTLLKVMTLSSCNYLAFTTQFLGGKKKAMKRFENIFDFHNKRRGICLFLLSIIVILGTTMGITFKGKTSTLASSENEPVKITLDNRLFDDDTQKESVKNTYKNVKISFTDTKADFSMNTDEFINNSTTAFSRDMYEVARDKDTGRYADITSIAKKKGYWDKMGETARQLLTDKDGKLRALTTPYGYTAALMCNKEVFEKAGLKDSNGNIKIPKTWEEVAQFAKIIKQKTGKPGICVIGNEDVFASWQFICMAQKFGANDLCVKNDDGTYTATVNTEGTVNAMKYLKALKWEYNVLTDAPESEDYNTIIEKVATGEAAMCIGTTDSLESYEAYGMNKDNLSVAPLPEGTDETTPNIIEGQVIAFSADATEEEIEAAMDCMEFLGLVPTEKNSSDEIISNVTGDKLKCETSIFKSDLYLEIADAIKKVISDKDADAENLIKGINENYQKSLSTEKGFTLN